MIDQKKLPKTLKECIRYFADLDICVEFVAWLRWPNGIRCPWCDSEKHYYIKSRRIWKCRGCRKQFSVKAGTIFEDSPIPLDKWMAAIWLMVNCKNGISSHELHRHLGVTQKSAWFMTHRIRLALRNGSWEKISGQGGPIEIDETFIGGNLKNMHKDKKVRYVARGGASGKTVVMGMLERETRQIRAKIIPNVKRETLQNEILATIEKKSTVYTDAATGYDQLRLQDFIHETVNHADEYVRGQIHTQGIENFWSLLKRGLKGTYVAVEPFHLSRYLDEQVFRYNNRATKDNPLDDSDRFMLAVSQVAGKRLTYADLTGKVDETNSR